MGPAWLFLFMASGVEAAVPHTSVHRLLHREDPEFPIHLAGAVDLSSFLNVEKDPALPGVLVVLASGLVLLVGDVLMQRPMEKVSYLALRPELFENPEPWCRGVLVGENRWAFVLEENAVA